jgi:cob(I)alamin adenosyltransferase
MDLTRTMQLLALLAKEKNDNMLLQLANSLFYRGDEMSLGTTIEQSKANRREYILDALYFRRKGLRKDMKASLNRSTLEKMNQRYFLGPTPF